jgi:HPt (histidine-containing phosphotransfer) domain-containing protein
MSDEGIPVLDEAVISELRESVGGDDSFVAELASAYLAEGEQHLAAMEEALARGDIAGVVRPAHTMKSSSASLGAMRLSLIAKSIEFAAREGRVEGLEAAVADARAAWDLTVAAMTERGMAG